MGVGEVIRRRAASQQQLLAEIEAELGRLYEPAGAQTVLDTIMQFASRESTARPARPLDESDVVLIAYGDHISDGDEPTLQTLRRFLDEHLSGLVDGIHVLPFHPSYADGGFSIVDHTLVKDGLGDWEDIRDLSNGRWLMADCVLNHISASHPWFKGFQEGDPEYADFFTIPTADFDTTNVVRPRATPLLTEFPTVDGPKKVWTTFGPDQVDINYRCPQLLSKMIEMIVNYIDHGARLLRFDAAHFIWKESGATCVHMPQVHAIIRILRAAVDLVDPSVIIVSETNVPHAENITYFGNGEDEAQMVYNFAFPSLLVHTLQTGDAELLTGWASHMSTPSEDTCFFNHSACHDGISMRGASQILSNDERLQMVERSLEHGGEILYRSSPTGDVAYEMCITYFDALSYRNDPMAVDRFICSQAIQLSLAGVPALYLSNLFGAQSWREGLLTDGGVRSLNRQHYDYTELSKTLADRSSIGGEVFRRISELLRIRRSQSAFHPNAPQFVHDHGSSTFVIERTSLDGRRRVWGAHNVSNQAATVPLQPGTWTDLFSTTGFDGKLELAPYSFVWLTES